MNRANGWGREKTIQEYQALTEEKEKWWAMHTSFDKYRTRPDIRIGSKEGDLVTSEDIQRAKASFRLFEKMYSAGDDGWKRFLIQTEDGGLQAMVLGLKPCILTNKFPDEYIEMLKKHSNGDIDVIDPNPGHDFLVFSESNVMRILPRILSRYPECFPRYVPNLGLKAYLSGLNLDSVRLSILPGESSLPFRCQLQVKCAYEDYVDFDTHRLAS